MSCADPEKLREADVQFKQKINAARGMTLWTDRELENKLWTRQQRNLLINYQDEIDNKI